MLYFVIPLSTTRLARVLSLNDKFLSQNEKRLQCAQLSVRSGLGRARIGGLLGNRARRTSVGSSRPAYRRRASSQGFTDGADGRSIRPPSVRHIDGCRGGDWVGRRARRRPSHSCTLISFLPISSSSCPRDTP